VWKAYNRGGCGGTGAPPQDTGTAPPGGQRWVSVADSSFSFPPSHAFLDLYVLRVIQHINVVGAEASAEVENESQHRSEPRISKFGWPNLSYRASSVSRQRFPVDRPESELAATADRFRCLAATLQRLEDK
jgi:hypothetical protein